jgi:hypothetical protein
MKFFIIQPEAQIQVKAAQQLTVNRVANRPLITGAHHLAEILKSKGLRHFSFLAILTRQLSLRDDQPVGWLRDGDEEHG